MPEVKPARDVESKTFGSASVGLGQINSFHIIAALINA